MERIRLRTQSAGLVAVWVVLLSAVTLLGFACGDSGSGPASNLTGKQKARLNELAESLKREGNLRPALPAYIPQGLDPFPTVLSKFEARAWMVFGSAGKHDNNTTTPIPIELEVDEDLYPGLSPLNCRADPPLEKRELVDLGIECVKVGGQVADLQITGLADAQIVYAMSFDIGDIDTLVALTWRADTQPSKETQATMKREILRVAESMLAD